MYSFKVLGRDLKYLRKKNEEKIVFIVFRVPLLTFGMSGVAELVLPAPNRPQHLQPVGTILIVGSRLLAMRCCCRRLSISKRQGVGLDEAGVRG